ncbi:MAG: Glyoxalase family protein [uncultured Solirubrobacteraceae bacterium]|uniref:Glyoxalase family protein n=1 Tax=uncultured Solirubrobacteraceae bacterium TaxID=1162706 RepID=A0A6J4SVG9_9ACTN|nr:MAG: Glyoxalase family protein [uncultured Solirubrobacteraceae bacterium]
MPPEGLHHITAITRDAPSNVNFYARILGLRLVKQTVNFDQPDAYHLYYGDEDGAPGSILTFFEFSDSLPGRHGEGMVHTIQWRVGSPEAIAFWHERLSTRGVKTFPGDERCLAFADPEGLGNELLAVEAPDAPLAARADDIPAEHALLGFEGIRVYASDPARSAELLERLGFVAGEAEATWTARGEQRHAHYRYEPSPGRGTQGAGTVHHVAWSLADDAELEQYAALARQGGAQPTPIIDRQYFHSVYFREPSGVLFELASRDIGFDLDEPRESLGSSLKLPDQYESRRGLIEPALTPIVNPRQVG